MIQIVCERCGKTKEMNYDKIVTKSYLYGMNSWFNVMGKLICDECFHNTPAGYIVCDVDDNRAIKDVGIGFTTMEEADAYCEEFGGKWVMIPIYDGIFCKKDDSDVGLKECKHHLYKA